MDWTNVNWWRARSNCLPPFRLPTVYTNENLKSSLIAESSKWWTLSTQSLNLNPVEECVQGSAPSDPPRNQSPTTHRPNTNMSVQQFCLRWNNHQPNFISVFSSLLHNATLVDVTLAAEGRQLQAHKVVLSACSSYFQVRQMYPASGVFLFWSGIKFKRTSSLLFYYLVTTQSVSN